MLIDMIYYANKLPLNAIEYNEKKLIKLSFSETNLKKNLILIFSNYILF